MQYRKDDKLEKVAPFVKWHRGLVFVIGAVGLVVLTASCALVAAFSSVALAAILTSLRGGWFFGVHPVLRFAILSLYLPQIGTLLLILASAVYLLGAFKYRKLKTWRTYVPLAMLVIYSLSMFLWSSLVLKGYAIPTKIDNAENRNWSEAMVRRALGDYPTGLISACVLSDQVVALLDMWSFVTPDNRMPALIWSRNDLPSAELPGNPTRCSALGPNWYVCYLTRAYQLSLNQLGECDFRNQQK